MTELVCAPSGQPSSRILIRAGARRGIASRDVSRSFVVCDATVRRAWPDAIPSGCEILELEGGEATKSFSTLERITRGLAQAGIDRSGELIAIGGGTIGDVAGMAAATYLRGIRLVQVPTTLLAMVDSSVGGKTAINVPEGKNLVGAFWAPSEVHIDPEFVRTLDDSEYRSGLGEVLKIGIGLDADLFEVCERDVGAILAREPDRVEIAIERAVAAKIRVVEEDFREGGARKLLNLGHTLGHALEAHSGFSLAHGIAVARGIHHALRLAEDHGMITASEASRAHALLEAFGFERGETAPAEVLAPFVERDKKRTGDTIDCVLPTGIGRSTTHALDTQRFLEPVRADRA